MARLSVIDDVGWAKRSVPIFDLLASNSIYLTCMSKFA